MWTFLPSCLNAQTVFCSQNWQAIWLCGTCEAIPILRGRGGDKSEHSMKPCIDLSVDCTNSGKHSHVIIDGVFCALCFWFWFVCFYQCPIANQKGQEFIIYTETEPLEDILNVWAFLVTFHALLFYRWWQLLIPYLKLVYICVDLRFTCVQTSVRLSWFCTFNLKIFSSTKGDKWCF